MATECIVLTGTYQWAELGFQEPFSPKSKIFYSFFINFLSFLPMFISSSVSFPLVYNDNFIIRSLGKYFILNKSIIAI